MARRRRLRVIASWNAHVGRSPLAVVAAVRCLIRDTNADVVCLQEARGYVTALRLAFPRWRVYARAGWRDATHNPVMVRRALRRGRYYGRGWGTVRNRIGWEYRGNPKPGRTWTWVRVDGVRILSLHRLAGIAHKANMASYAREAELLREWFDERGGAALVIGDANAGPTHPHRDGLMRLAREVGAVVIADPDEPGIDYAVAHHVRGHLERTNHYGSDHRAAVLTLKEQP